VQPRQLRRCAGHHRRLPAADPLRDGPPHLPHTRPELSCSAPTAASRSHPAKEDPALLERAWDDIAAALEAGELVGIFPEGRITDTGELYPFKPASRASSGARRCR
jgi:hypothetical protein